MSITKQLKQHSLAMSQNLTSLGTSIATEKSSWQVGYATEIVIDIDSAGIGGVGNGGTDE